MFFFTFGTLYTFAKYQYAKHMLLVCNSLPSALGAILFRYFITIITFLIVIRLGENFPKLMKV